MNSGADGGFGRSVDIFLPRRDHAQLLFCTCSAVVQRGLSVEVGDESAELALQRTSPSTCGRKLVSSTLLPISRP